MIVIEVGSELAYFLTTGVLGYVRLLRTTGLGCLMARECRCLLGTCEWALAVTELCALFGLDSVKLITASATMVHKVALSECLLEVLASF